MRRASGSWSRIRRWAASAWVAIVVAVIGAFVVGILEGSAMALVAEGSVSADRAFTAWASGTALAAVGAVPILLLLLVVLSALARLRVVRDWSSSARGGGSARAVLVWRAVLVTIGALGLAVLTARLVTWAYETYPDREALLFASFVAIPVTGFAGVIGFTAAAIDRHVAPRIAAARWPTRALTGRPMIGGLFVLGIASIAVANRLLRTALPSLHPLVAFGACTAPVVLLALRAARLGEYRRAQFVAVALLVAVVAGLAAVPGSDEGRSRVVSRGLISRFTFVALSHSPLADRDGDGFPGRFFGGADCHDSNPLWNPRGIEVAGNRIDENCTGHDADPAWPAARLARRHSTSPDAPRHNIILMSIDALRADHVGAWGYARPTTPTLDRLAARGTRFAWAFTSAPTTRPAITSLLTGRYPSTLPWIGRVKLRWNEAGAVGLPEVLRGAGYDTAAIACCDRFEKAEQEYAGFAFIDRTPVSFHKPGTEDLNSHVVADRAIAWLQSRRGRSKPFFLWMHFIDPHAPYARPKGGARFGGKAIDRYDAEVAFVDLHIGRILAAIEETGLGSSTIVAVTADHGEEFEEHGIKYHSLSLFNQVARIPMVVAYPGGPAQVVSTPVSIADLMPTLLDLVGIDGPGGMNGRSLASAVRHREPLAGRPVLMEVFPQKNIPRDLLGVAYGTRKVVWDREANSWSMFSLADDPDDRNDLAVGLADQLATMQQLLHETTDRELSRPASEANPR